VADAGEAVDKGVVVDGEAGEVVVVVHGFQGDHFQQQHAKAKHVCLGRDVGVVVAVLEFLNVASGTLSS